jgi:ATP-dependent Clp protease protease subunit
MKTKGVAPQRPGWFVEACSRAAVARAAVRLPSGAEAGFLFPQAAGEVLAKTGKVPADTTATIYLYEMIGIDWWTGEGMVAKDVIDAIAQAKAAGAAKLAVRILSPGGSAFEGLGMHEALKRCGMETTAYLDGLCASAATMVALGCDRVVAAPTSTWMMHRSWDMAGGHASDLRAMADMLDKVDRTIAGVYAAKSGKPVDNCLVLMSEEKGGPDGNWMNAEECKAAGFADEIARTESDDGDEPSALAVVESIVAAQRNEEQRIRLANTARRIRLNALQSPSASRG